MVDILTYAVSGSLVLYFAARAALPLIHSLTTPHRRTRR